MAEPGKLSSSVRLSTAELASVAARGWGKSNSSGHTSMMDSGRSPEPLTISRLMVNGSGDLPLSIILVWPDELLFPQPRAATEASSAVESRTDDESLPGSAIVKRRQTFVHVCDMIFGFSCFAGYKMDVPVLNAVCRSSSRSPVRSTWRRQYTQRWHGSHF